MIPVVEITFNCLPLRSITRWDTSWDVKPRQKSLQRRIRRAIQQHGLLNTYYLHDGKCVFQLTNHPEIGTLAFAFEGTVMTDTSDRRTRAAFLATELTANCCDWLTASAVGWFEETVTRAVMVEFDHYIAAGDLSKTDERMMQLETDLLTGGGFVGMGL